MLAGRGEHALLDVREVGPYGAGHPLRAINLPLGQLERHIDALVPRRGIRIVLTDGGEGYAALAASRLEGRGYGDTSILDGGAVAWEAEGHRLHGKLEVPVKGLAGFAEHHGKPRGILHNDLKAALDAGEDWAVLDRRPPDEYRTMAIPGGIDAPGPDLLRCFHELVLSPTTKVAVNCTTRTWGILGALGLRGLGVPNQVFVLRDGTRGWRLSSRRPYRAPRRCGSVPALRVSMRRPSPIGAPRMSGPPTSSTLAGWPNTRPATCPARARHPRAA
jgi:rhodanese-related sulfurtransferase